MFDSAIYKNRRQALRNKVQNGLILILGNNEAPANYPDNTYKFRQDSSFLYFFGHSHPGYAGVMDALKQEKTISLAMMSIWTILSGWDLNQASRTWPHR